MNPDLLIVLVLLGVAIVLFIIGKPRMDVIAFLMIVALPLSGILTVPEALSGFSDPSVLLIETMFVIGGGLVRTGLAYRMSNWLTEKAGNSETRLLILLMLIVAGLGSVMSSSGVVAIFIPVVLNVARRMKTSASRLLMPLSFAGLISGMLTLVATPPNMVIQSEMIRQGIDGFGFFSFTPIGLVILVFGIGYMLVARHWLGSKDPQKNTGKERRSVLDFIRDYKLEGREHRLCILPDSPLVGRTLGELQLRTKHGTNVIGIERQHGFSHKVTIPNSSTELRANDVLLLDIASPKDDLTSLCRKISLKPLRFTDQSQYIGAAEFLVPPGSQLIGKTILEAAFRTQYGLNVIGLRRNHEALDKALETRLELGDTVLVVGLWKTIRQLQSHTDDLLTLSLPAEIDDVAPALSRAPLALLSLAVTVGLMVSGLVPNVLAGVIGCLLMGVFRCINLAGLYKLVQWPSLILIVGMLPVALALQKTGGITLAVNGLVYVVGDAGPIAVLSALFLLTAAIGLFISNTATAALMAPVAVATAHQLGASPYPFAMIVALAASAAFMTPISSPVVTLVVGPGNYRFMDFVRIGVPFTILVMVVSVLLVPLLFPFQ